MQVSYSWKVQTCSCAANTNVVDMSRDVGFQLTEIVPEILFARVMLSIFVFESNGREERVLKCKHRLWLLYVDS